MANTSWQVREKYKKKTYTRIGVSLKKELVADWKEQLQKDNLTQAEFIRNAIENYLAKTKIKD